MKVYILAFFSDDSYTYQLSKDFVFSTKTAAEAWMKEDKERLISEMLRDTKRIWFGDHFEYNRKNREDLSQVEYLVKIVECEVH